MKGWINITFCVCIGIMLAGCGSTKQHVSVGKKDSYRRAVPKHVPVTGNMANPTKALLTEIDGWLGVPYKYAGEDKKGVDCSGLMMKVYNSALGIKLPRNSAKQQEFCTSVAKSSLAPGDLIFFSNSSGRVNHVGMYIGSGNMVHASSSQGVIISSLSDNYYIKNFHSAGRVDQYFAMLRKAATPVESTPIRLEPTIAPDRPQAAATPPPSRPSTQTSMATVSAHSRKTVRFSPSTPPPATAAAIDEARRKVLDEVVEQKADSILSDFFE